jgi:shikimate dehydrogenase
MVDCYAVVGCPIDHSKSPLIHRLFAEQTAQQIIYEATLIDPEKTTFKAGIQRLQKQGYQGINITVPFKLEAYNNATELTPRAQTAEAVNTYLFKEDGRIVGDNTDGIGLVNDIEINANRPFKNQKVLILGAGGAVQGILQPLLQKQPGLVIIANRTQSKAVALAERFTQLNITSTPLQGCGWDNIPDQTYDIIINGTAASLNASVPPIPVSCLHPNSLAYDMMYSQKPTIFMTWAKEGMPSCETRDGLGMLIGQAAEAFFLWRGIRPQTEPVIKMVRDMGK